MFLLYSSMFYSSTPAIGKATADFVIDASEALPTSFAIVVKKAIAKRTVHLHGASKTAEREGATTSGARGDSLQGLFSFFSWFRIPRLLIHWRGGSKVTVQPRSQMAPMVKPWPWKPNFCKNLALKNYQSIQLTLESIVLKVVLFVILLLTWTNIATQIFQNIHKMSPALVG